MRVNQLDLSSFRNIESLQIEPCDRINVIYGNNAQGKTNILEAIWLFTGNSSFRGSRYHDMIKFGQIQSRMKINFADEKRSQLCEISLQTKNNILCKSAVLNQVEMPSLTTLNGTFYAVVFSPSHLSLVTEGPKNRRSFIDLAIAQIKPQYKEYLRTYEKILSQRNALLKNNSSEEQLYVWDIQLAKVGTIISIYRSDYIKRILHLCNKYYSGISDGKEQFSIRYISSVFENIEDISVYDDETVNLYLTKLQSFYANDVRYGSTTCGIHRDDIDIQINALSVRQFGSQGQQRSSIIALKLAEAALLKKATGENPVMLLDDVMSELDEKRQDYILNHLTDMQVFITCCEPFGIKSLKNGQIFNVTQGKISKYAE